jgi:hypothetical protein
MDDVIRAANGNEALSVQNGLAGKHEDIQVPAETAEIRTFSDIQGHENQTAIEKLAARGIINGADAARFAPGDTMTRAEFAAVAARALGLKGGEGSRFADVSEADWFFGAVYTAEKYGIVTGASAASFEPDGLITRQEAAVMLARAAKLCGVDTEIGETARQNLLAQFDDYRAAAPWAADALAFCYKEKILSDAELEIQPETPVLRCEIAQALYNLLGRAKLL